jgi:hypothetical protein
MQMLLATDKNQMHADKSNAISHFVCVHLAFICGKMLFFAFSFALFAPSRLHRLSQESERPGVFDLQFFPRARNLAVSLCPT